MIHQVHNSAHKENEKIFKKIYLTYSAEIAIVAARYVGETIAEDLTQDLFLKVWNQKLHLLIDFKELRYFLLTSIRNACLDVIKHEDIKQDYVNYNKKQLMIEELSSGITYDFFNDDEEGMIRLFHEINKLPPKCRDIFIEAYVNEKKSSQIALENAISKRTVETQLYKALKTLRKALSVLRVFI